MPFGIIHKPLQFRTRKMGRGLTDFFLSGARYLTGAKGELFAGEQHGILRMPDGSMMNAQYMGPGTNVATRVRRGDPGRTNVDKASKAHDIRYSLSKSNSDIDRADDIMLRAVANKPDSLFNKAQAKLIYPKRQLARLGFRFGSTYGDPQVDNDPSLKSLYETTLAGLASQGFGKKKPVKRTKKTVKKPIKHKPKKTVGRPKKNRK